MKATSRADRRRESLFSDLVAFVERCLIDYGVPPEVAPAVASLLAGHLADYWGGQNFTIPKDFMWKLGRRELEIYDMARGDNLEEVARQYKMGVRGLRKLVIRVRDRLRAQARQQELGEQQMDLLVSSDNE